METIIFKTNMKCAGCIEKITPAMNDLAGKGTWKVDLENPDKTLTVSGNHLQSGDIQTTVERAGFKIEKI